MRDVIAEVRPPQVPQDGGDPVVAWRRVWEQRMAVTGMPGGGDDPQLVRRRRAYGSYPVVAIDLVLAFVGAIALSIPLIVLTLILFAASGHNVLTAAGQKELNTVWLVSPLFIVAGIVVTDGAMVLVLWYRLARLRLGWALVGLGRGLGHRAGRALLIGLGIGVVGLVLSTALSALLLNLGLNLNGQDQLLIQPLRGAPLWQVLLAVCAGTFVAPAAEELFFRGYVFRAVAVRKGASVAYPVSAGVFALFHLQGGLNLLPIVPVLFVLGLLLCFAYHRTGNLLANVTAHAVNNGAAYASALLLVHH